MFHFLTAPLVRWIGLPVVFAVLASTAKSFLAGPWWILAVLPGILFLVGWAVVLLVSTMRSLSRQNWKRVALLSCAFICSLPLIVAGAMLGDYIHLAVMYPSYAAKIYSRPDWQSREVRFDWGDEAVVVTDGIRSRVLIYDASGKTVVGDRPAPEGEIRLNIQHLMGNFYIALYYSG